MRRPARIPHLPTSGHRQAGSDRRTLARTTELKMCRHTEVPQPTVIVQPQRPEHVAAGESPGKGPVRSEALGIARSAACCVSA
jgi:hypothetical protein